MKIAIVTPTFPPYAGGIGAVAAAHARELTKRGQAVTVFTPRYGAVAEEEKGFPIVRLKPWVRYGNAALVPGLARRLRGFDIIHLHYPFFGAAELVGWSARRLRRRGSHLIIHYHMDVVGRGWLRFLFKLHTRFVLPRLAAKAERLIFTSADYSADSALAAWLKRRPEQCTIVPNGVDTDRFQPAPKSPQRLSQLGITPDQKVVLFVGGLDAAHYFKGVEYLIEAMSRLKQAPYHWRLVIVGAGNLADQYRDLAGQLTIGHRTIFTGYVPNADLPSYYQLADVVVLPSVDRSEAFGLALVEAMACGKPVVASDLNGVRSVVANGVTGLLAKPRNADDLEAKINQILSQPAVAQRWGEAGRQKAVAQYSWASITEQLITLYQKLCPRPNEP